MSLIPFRQVILLAAFLMSCAPRMTSPASPEVPVQEEPKLSEEEIRQFLLNAKMVGAPRPHPRELPCLHN